MEYKIEIDYTTGDSFTSARVLECLDTTWTDLYIVKKNLKRIKEHYEYVDSLKNSVRTPKDRDNFIDKHRTQFWFTSSNMDKSGELSLMLLTDEGQSFKTSGFWLGFFETLHGAKIIQDDKDMYFFT